MRVGVIQSAYVPWRGYFDFINSVDLFVIYDDVQYSKGSWRNRNQLKTEQGLKWLTVPVRATIEQSIDKVEIGNSAKSWVQQQELLIQRSLGKAPFYDQALELWRSVVDHPPPLLSELNVRMIEAVCKYLHVRTPIVNSRQYAPSGRSSARLLDLLEKLQATSYLSGPSADNYLDKAAFAKRSIRLEYKSYDYGRYPQQWGEFVPTVSILDLIANCGPDSYSHISSKSPNVVVIS